MKLKHLQSIEAAPGGVSSRHVRVRILALYECASFSLLTFFCIKKRRGVFFGAVATFRLATLQLNGCTV